MLHIRMKGKVSFSTHTRWWGKGAGNPRVGEGEGVHPASDAPSAPLRVDLIGGERGKG